MNSIQLAVLFSFMVYSTNSMADAPKFEEAVENRLRVVDCYDHNGKKLEPVNAYKWANGATAQQVGSLQLFVNSDGRPLASVKVVPSAASFKGSADLENIEVDHVAVTLASKGLTFKCGKDVLWLSPPAQSNEIIVASPMPAESESKRLNQAKSIASDIQIQVDDAEAKHADGVKELRLLPTPVHRYSIGEWSSQNATDGFVFAYVLQGGNPDCLVVIEAKADDNSSNWKCVFSRRSVSALSANLRGNKVYDVPRVGDQWPFGTIYRIRNPSKK